MLAKRIKQVDNTFAIKIPIFHLMNDCRDFGNDCLEISFFSISIYCCNLIFSLVCPTTTTTTTTTSTTTTKAPCKYRFRKSRRFQLNTCLQNEDDLHISANVLYRTFLHSNSSAMMYLQVHLKAFVMEKLMVIMPILTTNKNTSSAKMENHSGHVKIVPLHKFIKANAVCVYQQEHVRSLISLFICSKLLLVFLLISLTTSFRKNHFTIY